MNDDLLETLQADILAVLSNSPGLAMANILADNDGDIENRVMKALKTLTAVSGKMGLAIVVLLPEVTAAERNLPGPPLEIQCEIQVVEHVLINRGATGTRKRSSQAALAVLNALHHHLLGAHVLYAAKDPVKPLPVKTGYVSHAVAVHARADGLSGPGKPLGVDATEAGADITLACGTSGAAIRYTVDGSYPTPAKTLYTVPISGLASGTRLRAAAWKTGMNPGDVLDYTVG